MHIEKDDKKSSSKDKDKKSTSKEKDKKSDKSGGTPKKGADKGASDKKSSKSKKEGSPAGKNAFELQLLNEASKADLNEEAKSQKVGVLKLNLLEINLLKALCLPLIHC